MPVPNQEDKQRLSNEIEKPLLEIAKKVKTFRCKKQLYNSLAAYCGLTGKFDGYNANNKKLLELYRAHPDSIKENPGMYLSTLYNYSSSCIMLRKFDEVHKKVKEIRGLKATQPDEERRMFITAVTLEMTAYGVAGKHKDAVRVFNLHKEKLHTYFKQGFLQRYFTLCAYASASNAYLGNYKEALKIIAHVFSDQEIKKNKWIEKVLGVTQIIFISELGHESNSFIKNMKLRLAADKDEDRTVPIILEHLSNDLKIESKKEKKQLAEETIAQLEKISSDNSFVTFTDLFDVISWLESKISGRPMMEIIQKKLKNNV